MSKALIDEYRHQVFDYMKEAATLPPGDARENINKIISSTFAHIMRADAHLDSRRCEDKIFRTLMDIAEDGLDKVKHSLSNWKEEEKDL